MNRNNILFVLLLAGAAVILSCNSNSKKDTGSANENKGSNTAANDPKGIGKFRNVELTHPLDEKMVESGKGIYDLKCQSCHKLTDEKLVGPGWKGVTDRRQPEWIMNFVTNVDEMIEKDAEAQKMYEVCLVRMPNQSLSDDDARHVLEFMRKNDGKQ